MIPAANNNNSNSESCRYSESHQIPSREIYAVLEPIFKKAVEHSFATSEKRTQLFTPFEFCYCPCGRFSEQKVRELCGYWFFGLLGGRVQSIPLQEVQKRVDAEITQKYARMEAFLENASPQDLVLRRRQDFMLGDTEAYFPFDFNPPAIAPRATFEQILDNLAFYAERSKTARNLKGPLQNFCQRLIQNPIARLFPSAPTSKAAESTINMIHKLRCLIKKQLITDKEYLSLVKNQLRTRIKEASSIEEAPILLRQIKSTFTTLTPQQAVQLYREFVIPAFIQALKQAYDAGEGDETVSPQQDYMILLKLSDPRLTQGLTVILKDGVEITLNSHQIGLLRVSSCYLAGLFSFKQAHNQPCVIPDFTREDLDFFLSLASAPGKKISTICNIDRWLSLVKKAAVLSWNPQQIFPCLGPIQWTPQKLVDFIQLQQREDLPFAQNPLFRECWIQLRDRRIEDALSQNKYADAPQIMKSLIELYASYPANDARYSWMFVQHMHLPQKLCKKSYFLVFQNMKSLVISLLHEKSRTKTPPSLALFPKVDTLIVRGYSRAEQIDQWLKPNNAVTKLIVESVIPIDSCIALFNNYPKLREIVMPPVIGDDANAAYVQAVQEAVGSERKVTLETV